MTVLFVAFACTNSLQDKSKTGDISGIVYDNSVGEPVPVAKVQLREIIELLIPGKRLSRLTFIDKEQKGLVVSEKNTTFRFAAVTAAPRKSK